MDPLQTKRFLVSIISLGSIVLILKNTKWKIKFLNLQNLCFT